MKNTMYSATGFQSSPPNMQYPASGDGNQQMPPFYDYNPPVYDQMPPGPQHHSSFYGDMGVPNPNQSIMPSSLDYSTHPSHGQAQPQKIGVSGVSNKIMWNDMMPDQKTLQPSQQPNPQPQHLSQHPQAHYMMPQQQQPQPQQQQPMMMPHQQIQPASSHMTQAAPMMPQQPLTIIQKISLAIKSQLPQLQATMAKYDPKLREMLNKQQQQSYQQPAHTNEAYLYNPNQMYGGGVIGMGQGIGGVHNPVQGMVTSNPQVQSNPSANQNGGNDRRKRQKSRSRDNNRHRGGQNNSANLHSQRRSRSRSPLTEWLCVRCAFSNYDWRNKCKKCGEAKPHRILHNGFTAGPDDWKCVKCSNINYARRQECNRCKAPKELSLGSHHHSRH